MPGKRISELTALSGAGSANDDDVVIFDTTASETKRISRSQLAEGMQADVQVLTNKTIAIGSNTVTGTTAQFNTALTDNDFATLAGSEALTNKTINARTNTLQGSDASRLHWFKDLAALLADTTLVASTGDIVQTRAEGFSYTVAATGAADQNVTTAGGVKLYFATVGYGQDRTRYRTGGGGVRQTTAAGGWAFINDANHEPWGWSATSPVALSGTNLQVNSDFSVGEVGAFSVTPDESFAALGVTLGASVGIPASVISGFAPISGRVVGGASGILFNTSTGNVTSQTVDQPNGTITVVHGGISHTDSNASTVMVSQLGSPSVGRLTVATQSRTGFVLQYTRDLACRIACTTTTPGAEVFTVTESSIVGTISAAWITVTNCVRVTFPAVGNNYPDAVVMLSRDAPTRYMFTLDTQGSTTCDIFFYDTAGTLITAATSSMVFYFIKRGNFPAALPASGNLGFVQRDMVPIDFNQLFGASANLWLSFAHKYP